MKIAYSIFKNIGSERLFRFLPIMVFTMFLSQTILAQSPLCTSSPTTYGYEYISSVNINGNVTLGNNGYSGPGYIDYTGTSIASLVAGQTYPISVTVQTSNNWHEYVKIWFDFNGNLNLQDPGELIFNQDASWSGTHTFSGTFTIPTNAYNGNVFLRINMVYSVTPALCGSYVFGNTIDYKAAISGGVTPRTLTVGKAGTAGYIGDVTSSPSGINTASGFNSANFADGSTVILTATNASNGTFANWTGDVAGTNNSISFAMNANKNVTANFAAPIPVVSGVSGTTAVCSGNTTTLTAASTTTSPVFKWYDAASGGNLLFTGASYTTPTLLANATYYVSVINSDGNTSASRVATTVTVNALPTATISTSGSTTFCNGGSVILTATAASSYVWSTGETTQAITVNNSGNYTVQVSNANGCLSPVSAATIITVNGLPTASITTSGPTTFCNGGSVTLTAASASSYLWSTGATTQAIMVNSSGNYIVQVSNSNGCQSLASAATVVTVNNPIVALSSNNTNICNGSTATLTASGSQSYVWMPGSLSGSGIMVSPTTTTSYTAVGTTGNCTSVVGNDWVSVKVSYHTLAIKADGSLWSAGLNGYGELGNGTITLTNNNILTQVGKATWSSVFAGDYHSVGIQSDGSLWTWGDNSYGELGNGNTANVYSPTKIGSSTWASVAASQYYSLGIKTDGTLWGWGKNDYGQLGNGTVTTTSVPVQAGTATWLKVSAGEDFAVGIKTDGTLWAWGNNNFAQLGQGSTGAAITSPIQIGTATWSTLATGQAHALAIQTNGTLWCWGYNYEGALGIGSSTVAKSPTQVGNATWIKISARYRHSLGVKADYTLYSWGQNDFGQIGNGTSGSTTSINTPLQIGTDSWSDVSAGGYISFGLKKLGSLWAWGGNNTSAGAFGNGNYVSTNIPTQTGIIPTSITVTVNPLPTIDNVTGAIKICVGNNTTLTAVSSTSAPVFNWYDAATGGNLLYTGASYTTTALTATTTFYTSVTNSNGCISATRKATTVTVNALPVASITTSGSTSLCSGGSVTLTAASASSYLWSTGATTQAITATSAGSYTVMVTNANSCQSAASAATTVIVNTSPTATITASGAVTFCSGGSVTLTAGSASSYLWSTGETTQSITATTTGNYTVTVTNTNGCTAKSAATTVTVNALPTVSIAAAGVTSICSNSNVALNASTTGTISSYSWLNNGATISGSSNSNAYTASGAGNYSVLVTTSNGCVATSNVVPITIMASTTPVFSNGNSYLQFGTSANSCDTLATYALSVSGTPTPTVTYTLTGATTGNGSGTGSGLLYSKGVTNVTVTATNTCGATATTNFNVTVSDNVKPVMATKTATIYLDATGNATVKTTDVDNGSHDNCGAVSLSLQNSGTLCGSATENGVIVLTAPTGALITSVDFASYGTPSGSCGNFALGACNASNSLSIVNGLVLNKNSATITASNGVFGDPCNYTVKNMNVQVKYTGASSSNTFTCSQLGNNTVTLVATDVNGNANSQTVVVNVVDSTRPVVLTQNYTITLDATGNGTVTAANINNGSTDNCGIATLALDKTTFNYSNIGSNRVVLTVTDNSGNANTGTAIVTVLANGINANGQMITATSTQVNQNGAKGTGQGRTPNGQIFGTVALTAGASYQGGKVAYILVPGDVGYDAFTPHGLIAAPLDLSPTIQWWNGSFVITGAAGTAIGTGYSNTTKIISAQGTPTTTYAAASARAYRGGGYTDWSLPSKDELNIMFQNRALIGGFVANLYLCSTENSSYYGGLYYVWYQDFVSGAQTYTGKNTVLFVRPVRSF